MELETYGSKAYMQRAKEQLFALLKKKQGYKVIGTNEGYKKQLQRFCK